MTTFLGPRVSGAESIAPDGEAEILHVEDEITLGPVVAETFVELSYVLMADPTDGSLVNEITGNTAASDAYTEWQELYNLVNTGRPEYTISQQIATLNTSATQAWNVAQSANTVRYSAIPLYSWLNPALILTENPVKRLYTISGVDYRQWTWYKTTIDMRVQFYSGTASFVIPGNTGYRFETSPAKRMILKNTYQFQPQSMFTRSNKVACTSYYVGSGSASCTVQSSFIRELQQTGKKFAVTVKYITDTAFFPGVRI